MPSEYVQVFTTCGNKQDAEMISKHLVEQKLAACVQVIGPVSSTYWWEGKVENAEEWLCIIKSRKRFFRKIRDVIHAVHSYEVPEITAVSFVGISEDYSKWLENAIAESK